MAKRNLNFWGFLIVGIFMFFLGNVSAISCTCSSCDSCTAALNDNINCPLGVNLTADITDYAGTCINNPENFSNKIFDCQGHTIDGDDSGLDFGIYLYGKENNTIKNCVVTDFYYGIYLESSSNNTLTNNTASSNSYGILLDYSSNNILTNNTASSNSYDGISLYSSSNNNILTNNTASSNSYGIFLYSSSNNTLTNNTANSNNNTGIYLESSSNNILTNNAMNNNIYDNFGIYGSQISDYYQDINTSNTVDGKPIYYWTNEKNAPNNCKNAEINEANNAGFVALISCDNITVRNLNLEYNSHGVLLVNTVNSKISDVNASLNDYGIYLYYSSNNTLSNITANSNIEGIYLYNSSDNTLVNITANSNYYNGIYLYFSDNNILNSNRICKNNEVDLDFYDISNEGLGNSGDNNVCDTVYNWNDFSTWSCKYTCDGKQRVIFTFPFYFGWNLFSFPVST
ncbi:MAG: NosD domain-containing protein [Candidatus Altiarchaeota archaeon]